MASLTDVIAGLAQKIEDIEAAAAAQNAQAIADLSALTERAHEVLSGIQSQSDGLSDPQDGDSVPAPAVTDHAMGDSWPGDAPVVHPA
jgi:hypothetical protein